MHARQDNEGSRLVDSRSDRAVEAFASCPLSVGVPATSYLKRVKDISRWSERHGFRAALVHAADLDHVFEYARRNIKEAA
jgi:hypothetical protein